MIEGHASTYFDDWVSFPFVPGHEVVGELDDGTPRRARTGPRPRGPRLSPTVRRCGRPATVTTTPTWRRGHSTPASRPASAARPAAAGRRSSSPTTASSTASPTTSPTSGPCSSSRSPAASTPRSRPPASPPSEPVVAVLGAGTMGLAAVAGLVRYVPQATVVVGARYPHQQRDRPPARRPRGRPGRRAGPGRPADRRLPRRRRAPLLRRPRHDRRRRQRALDRRRPRHHPPTRAASS